LLDSLGDRPNGQLGPVRDAKLSEDPIQIFLNRALREMQFVCNLLVQFGLRYQIDNLPFPKAEFRVERSFGDLGSSATRTDPIPTLMAELFTASKAVSQGYLPELNGIHRFRILLSSLYVA